MTSQIKSYDYVENKIEIQGRQHYEMYEFDGQWDQNKEIPFVVEHSLGKHTWQIGQKVYFSHVEEDEQSRCNQMDEDGYMLDEYLTNGSMEIDFPI